MLECTIAGLRELNLSQLEETPEALAAQAKYRAEYAAEAKLKEDSLAHPAVRSSVPKGVVVIAPDRKEVAAGIQRRWGIAR